ncbi:MAG: deoxyribose-phosphate aldolase [Armatimonadetes bacterium 13_1_40CM_64_14]|nr:MAG: deoxyribose-phosphate aldolase [Armatimonadetes bacterium 13_1_40CM_64_14]
MTTTELARHIEHSVLAPQATGWDVEEAARVAIRWHVRALVVKPTHVSLAARLLADTGVKVVAVVGFPHGGQTTETKVAEIRQAVHAGAEEVDVVINIGALRQGQVRLVLRELRAVVDAAGGHLVKVIVENAYLTNAQKQLAYRLADRAGAAYVKTSTGFAPTGATKADVALMRRSVSWLVGIKAAGGIRSYADALALLEAGADLLGTSSTEAILRDAAREAAREAA